MKLPHETEILLHKTINCIEKLLKKKRYIGATTIYENDYFDLSLVGSYQVVLMLSSKLSFYAYFLETKYDLFFYLVRVFSIYNPQVYIQILKILQQPLSTNNKKIEYTSTSRD